MKIKHITTPINKYTFKSDKIKNWVELHCENKNVLNLFAGKIKLNNCNEIRNDLNKLIDADYHKDALNLVKMWDRKNKDKFDIIILDPPYSYRKSMEFYNGHKASRFNQLKNYIPNILQPYGQVMTFGYQSISMGKKRNFKLKELLIMSHGGAIHDTIATLEEFVGKEVYYTELVEYFRKTKYEDLNKDIFRRFLNMSNNSNEINKKRLNKIFKLQSEYNSDTSMFKGSFAYKINKFMLKFNK